MDAPAPLPRDQRAIDAKNLRILSVFYFLSACLAIPALGLLYLHYYVFFKVLLQPALAHRAGTSPVDLLLLAKLTYLVVGGFFAGAGTMNFLAGKFISERRNRLAVFVIAGINCLQVPFGAILGGLTIYLLMQDSVKTEFEETEARDSRAGAFQRVR